MPYLFEILLRSHVPPNSRYFKRLSNIGRLFSSNCEKSTFALLTLLLCTVSCSDESRTFTSLPPNGCDSFRPINVDGYFNSSFNPLILGGDLESSAFLIEFEEILSISDRENFRIGIGATYNLNGADPQTISIQNISDNEVRTVCAPAPRISLGPVLTDLDIVADQSVSEGFPVGTSLRSLFSVTVLEEAFDANFPPTQARIPITVPPNTEYLPLENYILSLIHI